MDPVTQIVAAIAAGAVAKAGELTGSVLGDAYGALKTWIHDKYAGGGPAVGAVEASPASKEVRDDASAVLKQGNAAEDGELVRLARALADALAAQPPERLGDVGLDLKDVEAMTANLKSITVGRGTAVRMDGGKFGELNISDIQAGRTDPN